MSFLVDTKAASWLYLSFNFSWFPVRCILRKASPLLFKTKRLRDDYRMSIGVTTFGVPDTPSGNEPVILVGIQCGQRSLEMETRA